VRGGSAAAAAVAKSSKGLTRNRVFVGLGAVGRGRGGDRGEQWVGEEAPRRSLRMAPRAADGDDTGEVSDGGDADSREEEQRLKAAELARLKRSTDEIKNVNSFSGNPAEEEKGFELVVGAEGVPQAVIEAERRSKPLRRWRLVTYALASSAAAAQVATVIDAGVMQWPVWLDEAPITLLTDVLVIISGSLLWRMELANRAESLRMIWQKTQSREESLKKAEAGLGDTLWTSRMRKKRDGL